MTYPHAWIKVGSGVFADYGRYVILHHPLKFMQYYYFPNALNIFYPSFPEIMERYSSIDTSYIDILQWYDIPENEDLSSNNDIYGSFLTQVICVSQIFICLAIIGIGVLGIMHRKKIKFNKEEKIVFWAVFAFGVIYYASTVFASPIALRYWLPMACVQFAFCYIILNKLRIKN
jgi:hypothetical protein